MILYCIYFFFFFFKQKTAYEMRISDWSSGVCSSDLIRIGGTAITAPDPARIDGEAKSAAIATFQQTVEADLRAAGYPLSADRDQIDKPMVVIIIIAIMMLVTSAYAPLARSEEHTSELQSLMRISYAVFCLTKKKH